MQKQNTWLVLTLCMGLGLAAAFTVDRYAISPENKKAPAVKAPPPAVTPKKTPPPSLPDTWRAVYLDRDEIAGLPPDIAPQDHIDILSVDRLPGSSKGSIARIILENIQVSEIVSESSKRSSNEKHIKGLTLLLTPEQGIILASVVKTSDIRLTRRSPDGRQRPSNPPVRYTPRDGVASEALPWSRDRSRITPGMRAFTVSIHESDGISAQTRPGDRVDVLFSVKTDLIAGEMQGSAEGTRSRKAGENKFARIFLENITILATEQAFRTDPTDPEPVNLVVLEVTPQDAEKLAMMVDTQSGIVLRLIARRPGDNTPSNSKGYDFNRLLHQTDVAARISVIRNGTKKDPQTFYK